MIPALINLSLFTAKSLILFILAMILLLTFFGLIARGKQKHKGKLIVKHLNKKYADTAAALLTETLSKKQLKQLAKTQKIREKARKNNEVTNVYVLNFEGDLRASAAYGLSEEVTAILSNPQYPQEVIVKIESAGGVVHGYGLAAAQLARLSAAHIPITVCIDKVAASGGYLMACVANKILAAPFAIIGSIGVIVQLPNFHRLLKEHHIDFEQLTAGEFKRTLTVFGENTPAGKEKLQQEIEEIQMIFKQLINTHRPQVNLEKVATGEHWLGQQAIDLKLIDEIKTSDSYLLERSKTAELYEIRYELKKPLMARLSAHAAAWKARMMGMVG